MGNPPVSATVWIGYRRDPGTVGFGLALQRWAQRSRVCYSQGLPPRGSARPPCAGQRLRKGDRVHRPTLLQHLLCSWLCCSSQIQLDETPRVRGDWVRLVPRIIVDVMLSRLLSGLTGERSVE